MAGNEPSFFSNIAPAVKNLAIINVLVWLFVLANEKTHIIGVDVFNVFSLHYWETDSFKPFQLVSYMFLHDRFSFSHVFFNMFNLLMFGNMMEKHWGTARFLLFYFVCGVGGALAQEALWSYMYLGKDYMEVLNMFGGVTGEDLSPLAKISMPDGSMLTMSEAANWVLSRACLVVGASAGVFGVMIGFAMTFPNLPLYFMFIPVPVKAKYMMGFFALLEVYFAFAGSSDNVAHLAHLGGIVFGIFLIIMWRKSGEDGGPVF